MPMVVANWNASVSLYSIIFIVTGSVCILLSGCSGALSFLWSLLDSINLLSSRQTTSGTITPKIKQTSSKLLQCYVSYVILVTSVLVRCCVTGIRVVVYSLSVVTKHFPKGSTLDLGIASIMSRLYNKCIHFVLLLYCLVAHVFFYLYLLTQLLEVKLSDIFKFTIMDFFVSYLCWTRPTE